jgi:hypothetical protein
MTLKPAVETADAGTVKPVPIVSVFDVSTSTQVRPDLTEIGLTSTPKAFQLVARVAKHYPGSRA